MSKWKEIKIDFFDEVEKKWCVDAWKSRNSNEEGSVIAKISTNGKTEYLDPAAKIDEYAQSLIKEKIKEISLELENLCELDKTLIEVFNDDIGYLMLDLPEKEKKKEINLELLHQINERVKKYYDTTNLHEDSSSQAVFDIMMLLKKYQESEKSAC